MSNKRKIFALIVAILIALTLCFIFGNSLKPQSESAESSGGLYERLKPVFDAIVGKDVITHSIFREMAHFGEFFVLGFEFSLLFFVIIPIKNKVKIIVYFIGLIVALIDESLQFLTDRGPEAIDVLIDYSGYLTAMVFVLLIAVIVKRFCIKKSA